MKKLFILAVLLAGCSDPVTKYAKPIDSSPDFKGIEIDGCEYIAYENGNPDQKHYTLTITHKGNCKFCTERNKTK